MIEDERLERSIFLQERLPERDVSTKGENRLEILNDGDSLEEDKQAVEALTEKQKQELRRRIDEFIERKALEGQLNLASDDTNFVDDFSTVEELRTALERIIENERVLEEITALLQETKEQFRETSVEAIAEKHDVIFIHALNPTFTPGPNSLLRGRVSWQQKLHISLALNPTLSCSTLQAGDGKEALWAPIGIILGKGDVEAAAGTDIGTQATGIRERLSPTGKPNAEQIEDAITHRNGYNEFVVGNAEATGLFVHVADNDPGTSNPLVQEALQESKNLGLPLYIIKKGKFFRPVFGETGEIVGSDVVTLQDIRRDKLTIQEDLRTGLLQDVVESFPFRVEQKEVVQELHNLKSYNLGRIGYLSYQEGIVSGKGKFEKEPKERNAKKRLVAEYTTLGGKVRVFEMVRQAFSRSYPTRSLEITHPGNDSLENITKFGLLKGSPGCINVGDTNFEYKGNLDPTNIREYIQILQEKIAESGKEFASKLSFLLYGIAEQAQELGDEDTANFARQAAETGVPVSQLEQTKKRINSDGEVILLQNEKENWLKKQGISIPERKSFDTSSSQGLAVEEISFGTLLSLEDRLREDERKQRHDIHVAMESRQILINFYQQLQSESDSRNAEFYRNIYQLLYNELTGPDRQYLPAEEVNTERLYSILDAVDSCRILPPPDEESYNFGPEF